MYSGLDDFEYERLSAQLMVSIEPDAQPHSSLRDMQHMSHLLAIGGLYQTPDLIRRALQPQSKVERRTWTIALEAAPGLQGIFRSC